MTENRIRRVVLVDDDEATRHLSAAWIRKDARFEVVGEAANGAEAVDLVAATHPDLVLLDLRMPTMGGLMALPLIRRRSPGTRVVVYAHDPSVDVVAAACDAGAVEVLDKQRPFAHVLRALDRASNPGH